MWDYWYLAGFVLGFFAKFIYLNDCENGKIATYEKILRGE